MNSHGGARHGVNGHMSGLCAYAGRTHARGRVPIFLRVQRLRRIAEAETGGLLRVLLVRYREMPAETDR